MSTQDQERVSASELTQLLAERIQALVAEHDGLRAAARYLQCDPAYLLRLHDGEKTNPSEAILKKLGLKRVVTYVRAE